MLKTIRLTPEDVKHFVDVASKCDFDIDICYNRYVVDAKSFLGVYGLDFTQIHGLPTTGKTAGYAHRRWRCDNTGSAPCGVPSNFFPCCPHR